MGSRHDVAIDRHRHAPPIQRELLEQAAHRAGIRHLAGLAVYGECELMAFAGGNAHRSSVAAKLPERFLGGNLGRPQSPVFSVR